MSKAKRILFLSFYYPPDLSAGSFRASSLIDAFIQSKESIAIDVITTMPNRYISFKMDAKSNEVFENININRISIPLHKSGYLDQIRSFTKYFRETLKITKGKKYDLILATSSRLFTALLGAKIANRSNIPLYLDIRDIFVDTMSDVLRNKLLKVISLPLLQLVETYTFNSAIHINLVSEGFHDYFNSKYKQCSYSFFSNGIDNEFLKYDFSKKIKTSKIIVTYAGNIGEGQGLDQIVPHAAKRLGDQFEFRIIGDGGAKLKLINKLKTLQVQNVNIIDPVSRKELKSYYMESDYLFMHLNNFEAFKKVLPSKVFEYGATGKHIIAGVDGYAAQFTKTNLSDSIIFHPGDVESFVNKLNLHLTVPVERNHFIDKFARTKIMNDLVLSILGTINSK